jgi:hypothetical protein
MQLVATANLKCAKRPSNKFDDRVPSAESIYKYWECWVSKMASALHDPLQHGLQRPTENHLKTLAKWFEMLTALHFPVKVGADASAETGAGQKFRFKTETTRRSLVEV